MKSSRGSAQYADSSASTITRSLLCLSASISCGSPGLTGVVEEAKLELLALELNKFDDDDHERDSGVGEKRRLAPVAMARVACDEAAVREAGSFAAVFLRWSSRRKSSI